VILRQNEEHMWVKLLVRKHLEINGKPQTKEAGDWVDVGKQTALAWLAANEAEINAEHLPELMMPGCGIFVLNGSVEQGGALLSAIGDGGDIACGIEPDMPWTYSLVWTPDYPILPRYAPAGFNQLQTWAVACPLWSRTQLACHVGSEEDKERTAAALPDLRVPLYDYRLLFLRRGPETMSLLEAWADERASDGDELHAFLRALYAVKPRILALRDGWGTNDIPPR
jgi:hypothetical protein